MAKGRIKTLIQRALARAEPEPDLTYRSPRAIRRALRAEALAPTVLRCAPEPGPSKPAGELFGIWSANAGAHKWHHYFPVYEEVLGSRDRPVRLLEIGIDRGASLSTWRAYLHPDSTIVGIDIDPGARQHERPSEQVHCRIGDQSDPGFLRSVVDEFGVFDVIIDDGSHMASHMITSFNHLFLDGLEDPGTYVVEDTHTNFWQAYRDQAYSFVDFAKDLVDLMHEHYVGNEDELLFQLGQEERLQTVTVSRIAAAIEEIRFRDSLVLIRRRTTTTLPVSERVT